jgi:hypothetical protein
VFAKMLTMASARPFISGHQSAPKPLCGKPLASVALISVPVRVDELSAIYFLPGPGEGGASAVKDWHFSDLVFSTVIGVGERCYQFGQRLPCGSEGLFGGFGAAELLKSVQAGFLRH